MALSSNLPLILSDPWRLEQVLSNLLANAMNYTPKGGTITVRSGWREDDKQKWVTFAIEDTGLGLAICKEIIDRLDGRITVESEPGHGTTFTVWLKARVQPETY